MPRDRLAELQKKSDNKNASNDDSDQEEVRLFIGEENDPIIILQTEVEAIRKELDVVTLNVKLLKQKQKDIVSRSISDDASTAELREIEELITKTSRVIQRKLKVLGNEVEKSEKQSKRAEENRIRKVQHMTLTRMFKDIMTEYLESQEEYKEKCKTLMIKQIKIVNNKYTDADIENMLQEENSAIFTDDLLEGQIRARRNLDEARALNFQIKKIEQSILEIHDLFQDLAALVLEQGESINRIENNVNNVGTHVSRGVTELKSGKKKLIQSRKVKIILIVVILVVLAVVIGVIIVLNR